MSEQRTAEERSHALDGSWLQDAKPPSSAPTDSLDPLPSVLQQISIQEYQDRDFAVHCLTWLKHAKQDLSPTALVQSYTIRQAGDASSRDFNRTEEDIVSVCKGLVTIVPAGKEIKIVKFVDDPTLHQLQECDLVDPKPHLTILSTCLTYLQSDEFAKDMPSREGIERRPRDHGLFVHYAVDYWMKHLSEVTKDELAEAERLVTQFLECDEKVTSWYRAQEDVQGSLITGLHVTAAFGFVTVAKSLLEKGHNVNATTTLGQTPLHWAVMNEHPSMVKLLLENSAQRDIQDVGKNTALHLAAMIRGEEGPGPYMEMLCEPMGQDSQGAAEMAVISNCMKIRNGLGFTPFDQALLSLREERFHPASRDKDVYGGKQTWYGIAKLLARLHPVKSIDSEDPYSSPMQAVMLLTCRSSETVKTELVEVLLQEGTDVSRPTNDDDRWHPLIEATTFQRWHEIVENLLKKGSPVDVEDGLGMTPLRSAIMLDEPELVKTLLGHGADANYTCKDENGITPLMEAFNSESDWLIVEYLLESGADPNAPCRAQDGSTALHCAVEVRSMSSISMLFQHKADLSIRNHDGMTALDIAVKNGYKNVVRHLLFDQDQIGTVDRDTIVSAVRLASRTGHVMMIHQLSGVELPACKPMNYSQLRDQCDRLALYEKRSACKILELSKRLNLSKLPDLSKLLHLSESQVYELLDDHELLNTHGLSDRDRVRCTSMAHRKIMTVTELLGYQERASSSIKDGQRARSDALKETFLEAMNMQDEKGYTVLHHALQSRIGVNRFATILTLLSYNAKVDVKDNKGRTPLMLAREMELGTEAVLLELWSIVSAKERSQ